MTGHVCVRTISTKTGQAGDDETRIFREEALRIEIEGFENTGSEGFNEDVCVLKDGFEEGESLWGFEVEGYGRFVTSQTICSWRWWF